MTTAAQPHPVRPLPLRWLRIALVIGALIDLSGAAGLLLMPEKMSEILHAPVSGAQLFWPGYASVFLIVLPAFYLLTAINPNRALVNVGAAIFGRAAGAVAYGYWWTRLDRPMFALGLASMNLVMALWYWALLGPDGREQLARAMRMSDQP